MARLAFQGLSENEIGRARISMMARSSKAPSIGRIQMRKTNLLQIMIFDLQRAAGPYRWAMCGHVWTYMDPARLQQADWIGCNSHNC